MVTITNMPAHPGPGIGRPVFSSEELGGGEQHVVGLRAPDGVETRGVLYRPAGKRPTVGLHLIHPRGDFTTHYAIPSLVRAGYTVLGCWSRYPNNDFNCIHERLVLDVAGGIQRLRDEGCEQVVQLGCSGGSSVAPFYQNQATTTPPGRLTATPAGDPLDLNQFDLSAADGLIMLAEHAGEGATLLKWLDPSVTDEDDPISYDPSIDMFHPDNGWRIPPEQSRYSPDFLQRYRAAQRARCERIDQIARDRIAARRAAAQTAAELESKGDLGAEWRDAVRRSVVVGFMQVHRAQADPLLCDHTIDPDDRDFQGLAGYPYSARTDLVNWTNGAIAAFLTPEAWLSTWSGLSSRASTIDNIVPLQDPLLVIHFAGDWCTTVVEGKRIFEAASAPDKEMHIVPGQDHYGLPILPNGARGPQSPESFEIMTDWLKKKFPV